MDNVRLNLVADRYPKGICGIQPADTHCKLYLHHVKPGDVAGVKVEGSGKHARHVKVAGLAAAQAPEIRCVLERARQGAR